MGGRLLLCMQAMNEPALLKFCVLSSLFNDDHSKVYSKVHCSKGLATSLLCAACATTSDLMLTAVYNTSRRQICRYAHICRRFASGVILHISCGFYVNTLLAYVHG